MVVDDIEDDRDPVLVGRPDEALEGVGPAIARLDREQVGRVVAPRHVARELERGHDLDRADTEVAQVGQAADRPVEVAATLGAAGERPDMQLVDHEVVAGRHLEGVVAPVERRGVVHHAVTDRVGHLAGVRVHP